jgi:hypothetical protein
MNQFTLYCQIGDWEIIKHGKGFTHEAKSRYIQIGNVSPLQFAYSVFYGRFCPGTAHCTPYH